MFYLPNLSSSVVKKDVLPWDFKATEKITDAIMRDKKARDAWINSPGTNHHVYSFFEGLNANLRLTRPKTDGEGNPPIGMWAIVADFDCATPLEEILKLAKELPIVPNRIERTLSGNWRFVWLFAKMLPLPSFDFAVHFLKKFEDFAFRVSLGAPGFDRGAFEDPCRMYTNSCEWLDPVEHGLRPNPISEEQAMGWLVKAGQTFKWDGENMGVSIPLDVVEEALKSKYPRFLQEWSVDFAEGAQGTTFWVDGSSSPKSATVRPTGMQTFSAHAHKSFFPWAELLGIDFVKQYEAESLGRAVKDIFTDGKTFFRKNSASLWVPEQDKPLTLHLKVNRLVPSKPDKKGISDIDRCLTYIYEHQRVVGAGPFVMREPGPITIEGELYLNTRRNKCIQPAEGVAVYGPAGQFPWLSAYFEALPEPYDPQFAILISWLSIFYYSVLHNIPQQGHGLVIAGGVGIGKTFLNTAVIGPLVGGHADASKFFAGEENFNSAMLERPYLSSDDSTSAANRQTHRLFSETVKQFVANTRHLHKAKFIQEVMVEWYGRVGISCNDDEESIRKIPDLDISILDKLIILRGSRHGKVKFLPDHEMKQLLARELPWFARWLLQWEIPAEFIGEPRFKIKHYCEPTLFKTAQQSSNTSSFQEILEDFLNEYFNVKNIKEKHWEGTAYQLHKAILTDPSSEAAMRAFTVDSVGRHLSMLKNKGAHIEAIESDGSSRRWRLFPDTFNNQNKKDK